MNTWLSEFCRQINHKISFLKVFSFCYINLTVEFLQSYCQMFEEDDCACEMKIMPNLN
jgi:hypothetical protein